MWTKEALGAIATTERGMMLQMLGRSPIPPDGDCEVWERESAISILRIQDQAGITPWAEYACQQEALWAGHVQRCDQAEHTVRTAALVHLQCVVVVASSIS